MHQEIQLEIKRQRKVKKRPGIGFNTETVPTWRTYVNLHVHIPHPSDEDIRIILQVMNGISPFDFDDQWSNKMFTWDIYTHQSGGRYDNELNILPKFEEIKAKTTLDKNNWISYMKHMK